MSKAKLDAAIALRKAAEIIRQGKRIPAIQALEKAFEALDTSQLARTRAHEAFSESLIKTPIGIGVDFQHKLLDQAAITLDGGKISTMKPALETSALEVIEKIDTTNLIKIPAPRLHRAAKKKYKIGCKYELVGSYGLQKTKPGARVLYQLSRRVGQPGIMDVPNYTEVTLVDDSQVYVGKASSRRFFLEIPAGIIVSVDGQSKPLEKAIIVAGVVNHIDVNDSYNDKIRDEWLAKHPRMKKELESAEDAKAS